MARLWVEPIADDARTLRTFLSRTLPLVQYENYERWMYGHRELPRPNSYRTVLTLAAAMWLNWVSARNSCGY